MKETVIQVKEFKKIYGSTIAVDGINFEVERGEIFGLLGPNGAGKTTTLECLEGLRKPDGGSLEILGFDPNRPGQVNKAGRARRLRDLIGVQLQSSGLPGSMTPREAMQFFCAYHQVPIRYDLLERLGLGEKSNTQFQALSTGQQRRLALALALAHKPEVVFLDEPTAGLDVPARLDLHELMHEMQAAGTTIILATHDMAEAEKMASRVAILLKGKIVVTGTPSQITATGSGLTKISVSSEKSTLSRDGISFPAVSQKLIKDEYAIYYSSSPGQTVPAVIAYLEKENDRLNDLRVERPSLEERFLEITQKEN